MKRAHLRFYILMTSLALTAGTALGYWTGQGSAETSFANDCINTGVFVVYDHSTEAHRHFHCFELERREAPEEVPGPETPVAREFSV
ncbi:MAG: hypothetical protein AAGI11_01915 [Pseudomonadota bacterium]